MRVLVCGGRHWNDQKLIDEVLSCLPPGFILLQGGARGADTLAGRSLAPEWMTVIEFPADWEKYGKKAGILRNLEMLEARPGLVLAFHKDLESSRGTRHTVSESLRRKIPTILYDANGEKSRWNTV